MTQILIPGFIVGTAIGIVFGWALEARHFTRSGVSGRFYLAPTLIGNVGSVLLIVSFMLDRQGAAKIWTLLISGALITAGLTMRFRARRRPRSAPAIYPGVAANECK